MCAEDVGQAGKEWNGIAGRVKTPLIPSYPRSKLCLVRVGISGSSALEALEFGCGLGADGLCISEVVDTPVTGCFRSSVCIPLYPQ